ncbi:MAG TPA: biotin carboxylase N-terminal domain-containing protein [Acidimicrobiales bacterium]|nr:biotin carboxylase N-terminal domain-containing protein [Acidimicrobiales bacterium]
MAFDSLLVANRGEIARRVLHAARSLGLGTVAVFSAADRRSAHVREADRAFCLGPAPAADSYLSVEAVMAAVEASGAGAVHPGYGFLAEHAELARACERRGVVFVGPTSSVIEEMGRKDEARRRAVALGVPVVPGLEGSADELAARAAGEVGLPLLVKAVAGGGGKAMRVVRAEAELTGALAAAGREARAAFGDEALFVERFVEGARHVEVQILADEHGGLVHLFERDCSVQRRHQKVVEEAPATFVGEGVLTGLRAAALRLAGAIGYRGAGTVEFLVRGDEFFFLEMNTRLQVEHRVTEALCGVDLVALQLLVALGRHLPFTQEEVVASGHAIEARVYAEDPAAGYLPQAGRARLVRWPSGVLVDEALASGDVVTSDYDPMLAKLVAHGPTREAARLGLLAALDETAIIGLGSNLSQLYEIVSGAAFAAGRVDTTWLEREGPTGGAPFEEGALLAAAWAAAAGEEDDGPLRRDGWRLAGAPAPLRLELSDGTAAHEVRIDRGAGRAEVAGKSFTLASLPSADGLVRLEIDGEVRNFVVEERGALIAVSERGRVQVFGPVAGAEELGPPADGEVRSPVPGTLSSLAVGPGDAVECGDAVASVESMKTELTLRASVGGKVTEVLAAVGEHVALDQLVALIEPGEAP